MAERREHTKNMPKGSRKEAKTAGGKKALAQRAHNAQKWRGALPAGAFLNDAATLGELEHRVTAISDLAGAVNPLGEGHVNSLTHVMALINMKVRCGLLFANEWGKRRISIARARRVLTRRNDVAHLRRPRRRLTTAQRRMSHQKITNRCSWAARRA